MPTLNRTYIPRTSRLLSEYLAKAYPQAKIIQEARLIAPDPEAKAKYGPAVHRNFGGTLLGYPDAVVILPNEVQIWEAKIFADGGAIGQLEGYGAGWPQSTLGADYVGRPVTLHLLATRSNSLYDQVAAEKGITVVIYAPAWFLASQMSTEEYQAQRKIEQQAANIVAEALAGKISDLEAESQMESIGISLDSAKLRLVEARNRVAASGA